uniref:HECT domain-containing protein n=1 Tax=Oncorhynchus mykiss TaxID=8022 RepID=A0A8C7TLL1_ONCMY
MTTTRNTQPGQLRSGSTFKIKLHLSHTLTMQHVSCDISYVQILFYLPLDGKVFTWGQNSSGQLGLGEGEPSTLSPQPVKSLSGIPLAQITAGGDHSFALSLSGAVFGWGKNSAGQLGLRDTIDRAAPAPVDCLNLKKTVAVSCGGEHTAVLTKGGLVFTFGSGRYGQLGHNTLRNELRPRLVAELWGAKVTQIACGRNHTLAFVGSFKNIYSFGRGEQGQLGNGVKMDQSVPLPVQFFTFIFREITKTFSSASCLNGSFLDKRHDKHYQTSLKHSGLDLSLARMAFQRLAEKDKVEDVVQRILLPSLSKDPIGVEGLRVYLIIPELLRVLRKQQRGIDITEAFAAAVLRLNPDKLQVLEGLWSTLSDSFFRTVVKAFHSASAEYLQQMAVKRCDHGKSLKKTFGVLQRLYDVVIISSALNCFCLQVKFQAENGVDEGGVSLEFFSLLGRELLTMEPKTLEVYESGLAWLTTDALYNQCVLNLCFPLALFKKLLGLTTTLDDLKELSPTEARYNYSAEKEEGPIIYVHLFNCWQELIPNGEELPVTMVNRKKYVDLYVDMKLNKSVQIQFADFESGFYKGCPTQTWRMFLPEELMTLLQGDDNYEWDKLRENANYQGYRPTDDIIQNFWSVFTEFSEEEKKKFLTFLTGTDRLPRGRSLSKLQMQITSLGSTDADEYYPKAQTCSVTLCLPNYSSIDTLQEKLLHAITHCDVFGDA